MMRAWIVITAAAGALLLAGCGDAATPTTELPIAAPTTAPSTTSAPTTTVAPTTVPPTTVATTTTVPPTTAAPTTTMPPVAFPNDPLPAFLAWLEAVHDGDVATAWALTGPYTQSQVPANNINAIHGELEEGWGAWHIATGREIDVSDIDEAALISMRGTVSQEGFDETRAAAMPMVKDPNDGGNWKVEWLPGPGPISWTQTGQQVCARGPATFEQRLYVDGTQQNAQITLDDQGDPMAVVCFTLGDNNVHTVTVVFLGDLAGTYNASAYLYPTGP